MPLLKNEGILCSINFPHARHLCSHMLPFVATRMNSFEDITWLFQADNRNRGILRLNFDEAALLWKTAKSVNGNILEVGRRHGGSCLLLSIASPNSKIISIDIAPAHNPKVEEHFKTQGNIELLIGNSRAPLQNRDYQMLFIDGDHSYEGVLKDTVAHFSQLDKGAALVYHDALPNAGRIYEGMENHFIGVLKVCDDLIAGGYAQKKAGVGSLIVLEKLKEIDEAFPIEEELFDHPDYQDPKVHPKASTLNKLIKRIKKSAYVLLKG